MLSLRPSQPRWKRRRRAVDPMIGRKLVAALASIASLVGLFGCKPKPTWSSVKEMVTTDFPDVEHVSVTELKTLLDEGDHAPVLLDVREEDEYAVSHLPGAIQVPPGDADTEVLDAIDRDAPIVTYCSVGYRSSQLAAMLEERGFTNVRNLDGSIFAWANQGLPVVREGRTVREVHPYDPTWGNLLNEELQAYEPGVPVH